MDLVYLLAGVIGLFNLIAIIMIILGDADIFLQIAEKIGKPIKSMAGKVVWITGASSGIGEALSYELAKAGCRLVLSARRTEELDRVKKECMLRGSVKDEDILVLTFDALDMESHKGAVTKVLNHFKQIDILVNNAGRSQRAEWVKTSLQVDRDMIELNVFGVLSLTKQVLPHMIDRREGHIVNMSSIAGKIGAPLSGSYTGSKHAIQGWFDCLRVELAHLNIFVSNICPGPVFSNLLQTAFTENPNEGWFDSLRVELAQQNIFISNICPGPVFSNNLQTAFTENAGQELNSQMNPKEKRMKTDRCAYLTAVAMANKLYEAWITRNPVLLIVYINQYMPNIGIWMSGKLGLKMITKIREGQH